MFQYRDYQREAIDAALTDLKVFDRIGAVLPTGAGKTEVFIGIIDEWLKLNPGKTVLILSHLSLLTTQTTARLKDRAPHITYEILQAMKIPKVRTDVVISTMQSSRIEDKIKAWKEITGCDVGLIIIDEAHYMTVDSYEKAMSYFPAAKILGVTATPFKSRQIMLNKFQKVSYSISLKQLIGLGFLVEPNLTQLVLKDKTETGIMAMLVRLYKEKEDGKPAVVFMKTKAQAEQLRNLFVNEGVTADCITCNVNGEVRDDLLAKFKRGETKVLTTVNVLSAGFDAPCLEVIMMPYATTSPTLYMQRVGRGLRTHVGKDGCRVYICGDAPSIAKGVYHKVQTYMLNGSDKFIEHKSMKMDLLVNDPGINKSKYEWTQKMVTLAEDMEKWNLKSVADIIVSKKFPKRYLDCINTLYESIPKVDSTDTSPITGRQKNMLEGRGFHPETLNNMTKGEASQLLAGFMAMDGKMTEDFRIPSGRYAGKRVDEVPEYYQNYVMTKYPNSKCAKAIQRFWNRRRA